MFIGGDITPIDLITHFPVLCEENSITYVFLPTSESLDKSLAGKAHSGVILIAKPNQKENEDLHSQHASLVKEIRKIKTF
jgi:H/ACA ribonucleoprotein complex subunit 2